MSELWTPGGEDPREGAAPTEEERAAAEADLAQLQEELAATPVVDVVANHAIGLWQLAILHLTREDRDLEQAQLGIDAFAALVEGLGDRLGPNADPLREALAQLRLAYVQVSDQGAESRPDEG